MTAETVAVLVDDHAVSFEVAVGIDNMASKINQASSLVDLHGTARLRIYRQCIGEKIEVSLGFVGRSIAS